MFRGVAISLCMVWTWLPGIGVADGPVNSEVTPTVAADLHFSTSGAGYWDLNESEVSRLNELVKIERAFSDVDSLSPFEILGKYAETQTERRRYAERYIDANLEHQKRSLRWAIAVANLAKHSSGGQALESDPVISGYLSKVFPGAQNSQDLVRQTSEPLDRFHLFVDANGCQGCESAISYALDALSQGEVSGVDVVFIGMEADDKNTVIQWIYEHDIDTTLIDSQTVTLNRDSSDWVDERGNADAPYLVDVRNGEVLIE